MPSKPSSAKGCSITTPTIIDGDLFGTDAKYICHQCNCITTQSAGLAADIFNRYPWADIYSDRMYGSKPPASRCLGDIVMCGDGVDKRFIINMLAQFYPGKPKFSESAKDGFKARRVAFANCLLKMLHIPSLHSVAFPWGIGCCMAGGNWDKYLPMIERFAAKTRANVSIYRYGKSITTSTRPVACS